MKNLNLFIPLTKVDEENRLVYGIATAEAPDQSGEICDYATTVPYYKAWSESIEKATDGKSKGNLRSMHAKIASGKVTQISFNDSDKQIEICAKVIDGDEWKKVVEGVYTGFSQGGRYVKTWKDGGHTRYTADPSEISLVDNPCLSSATFTVLKSDGATELRKFKTIPPTEEKIMQTVAQVWQATDGSTYPTKAEALKKNADIEAAITAQPALDAVTAINDALNKREFTDDERKAAAEKGTALPDGSFPIENKGDLENAVKAVGRAKDEAAAKAHIITRAKALGATDMLPKAWEGSTAEKATLVDLKKYSTSDVWDAQTAMNALCDIQCLYQNEIWQDGQTQNEQLTDLEAVIAHLKSFIASEIMEHVGSNAPAVGDGLAMAAGDELGKAGAKIGAASRDQIMKMHKSASDHMDAMDAGIKALGIGASKAADTQDLEKVAKLEDDNAALIKTINSLNASLESVLVRVKHLEAQPLPSKGSLYAVTKNHEVQTVGHEPVETVASKATYSVPNHASPAELRARFSQ